VMPEWLARGGGAARLNGWRQGAGRA